jgi:hypothetical protein
MIGSDFTRTVVVVVVVVVVGIGIAVKAAELPPIRLRADGDIGAVASPHAASTSKAPPKKTAFFQLM